MVTTNKVYGLLGLSMKAGKLVFGSESCIDMVKKKKVKLLILSEDSSQRTINNFKILAQEYNIPMYIFGNKENLSKAIGKDNKTVVGIKDNNLANAIKKILDGGDVIG